MITLGIKPCLVKFEDFLRAGCNTKSATLAQILVKSRFTFCHEKPPKNIARIRYAKIIVIL